MKISVLPFNIEIPLTISTQKEAIYSSTGLNIAL